MIDSDGIRARHEAEYKVQRDRANSESRTKRSVFKIHEYLSALQDVPNHDINPEIQKKAKAQLASFLWDALPGSVVEIDYGGGSITRDVDIPEEQKLRWDLKHVDDHGGMLSKQIGQPWEPIIK